MDTTTGNENDKPVNQPVVDEAREEGRKLSELTLKVMDTLRSILPYLDTNLELANLIYSSGAINGNAWELIKDRHKGANIAVSSIDFEHGEINDPNLSKFDDCEKRLCSSACWVIIDIRDVIGDGLTGADKDDATAKMNQLITLLRSAGYTATDRNWNIPSLPIKR